MKVVVKTIFRDKYTRKVYKLDDEIDVTDKRYEEIKQYVEKIEDKKEEDEKIDTQEAEVVETEDKKEDNEKIDTQETDVEKTNNKKENDEKKKKANK